MTCKIDTNRSENFLLILTSCLFISFNTQDVTFRCTAAVSRSVTGGVDVNKQLGTELHKQKVSRILQPHRGIKYVGVFNFNVAAAKDPVFSSVEGSGTQRQLCSFCCSSSIEEQREHHVLHVVLILSIRSVS